MFDMCMVFDPSFVKLSYIKQVDFEVQENKKLTVICDIKKKLYQKVICLANMEYNSVVANAAISKTVCNPESEPTLFLYPNSTPLSNATIDCLADQYSATSIDDNEKDDIVQDEWERYLKHTKKIFVKAKRNYDEPNNALLFWKNNENFYPNLSKICRSVLGCASSSSSVEVDNGVAKLYAPSHSTSLSPELLEMKMFVNRNDSFLNWDEISEIDYSQLKKFYPSAPCFPFVDNTDEGTEYEVDDLLSIEDSNMLL